MAGKESHIAISRKAVRVGGFVDETYDQGPEAAERDSGVSGQLCSSRGTIEDQPVVGFSLGA